MSLVPVNLRSANLTVGKAYSCDALQLTPATGTKLPPDAHDVPNITADSNGLNVLDLTENLKEHIAV